MTCMPCAIISEKEKYVGIIKKFNYWTVIVSREQHTIGTLVLMLNRHTVRFSSITDDELLEFHRIQISLEKSLDVLFSPDLYNYLQCGNSTEHLHIHLIPRYKKERKYLGKKYVDVSFGDSVKETTAILGADIIKSLRTAILNSMS